MIPLKQFAFTSHRPRRSGKSLMLAAVLEGIERFPQRPPDLNDVVLMLRPTLEALKRVNPVPYTGSETPKVDRICGMPFEIFDTIEDMVARADELKTLGQKALVVC